MVTTQGYRGVLSGSGQLQHYNIITTQPTTTLQWCSGWWGQEEKELVTREQ